MESTGTLTSVLPKLGDLLVGEYKLQKGVKGEIKFLRSELESMQAALEKVSRAPGDNHDKIWAREVRELSYDIEDSIDTFMVCIKSSKPADPNIFKKCLGFLGKVKIRRKIATNIRNIKIQVEEVSERRKRYMVDGVGANCSTSNVDPRVLAMYKKATELVGIEEPRDELIKMLTKVNEESIQQMKIVSVVGFGGLGKTTLANAVYEDIKENFKCRAFVSVSRDPDVKKLFKDILYQLDKAKYANINEESMEEKQLIDEIRQFLGNKSYLITIDDIWDIKTWEIIRCALPANNGTASRIIITTRIIDLAKQAGGAYELQPLSQANSRMLLHRRIFGNDKCLDEELAEVTEKILKRCAGVPLAIITISSLLATKGRDIMEWEKVCNSIGTGLERSNKDVQDMILIVSLSYYNMPSYLRTCLLYLSVFPEDTIIRKHRLIWMWVAEGFIRCESQGVSLYVLGESYFNELINRSMIQPVFEHNPDLWHDLPDKISGCRVHDMVLDLIRSLSSEENFVTVPDGLIQCMSLSRKVVRRLSLQNSKVVDDARVPSSHSISMRQVRSVIVFPSAFNMMPALAKFEVLRVLDLEGCNLSKCCSSRLKYVGNLLHLRYLGLRATYITELPEVGNLRFLQTLDLDHTRVEELPSTVVELRHLMCLRGRFTGLPKGFRKLVSLEELLVIFIGPDQQDLVKELGHLTELRVLVIQFNEYMEGSLVKSLVDSVGNMQKVRSLLLSVCGETKLDIMGETWEPSRHLRTFRAVSHSSWTDCLFSRLPSWISRRSLLLHLSILEISVMKLQQEDLDTLGMLPALLSLKLLVARNACGLVRLVVGTGGFPCLVTCALSGFVVAVVFRQGAMQRLEKIDFEFCVRVTREMNGGFEFGLEYLPSLQHIRAFPRLEVPQSVITNEPELMHELAYALAHTAEIHPNHPAFGFHTCIHTAISTLLLLNSNL